MKLNLKDLAERVATTFVLTFLGIIVMAGTVDLDAAQVALIGGVAAALSLVKNLITEFAGVSSGGSLWQDIALRTMATYVQVWIGLVVVAGADGSSTLDLTQLQPALLAAVPATLGVLKGLVASRVGDPNTAGFFDGTGQHRAE